MWIIKVRKPNLCFYSRLVVFKNYDLINICAHAHRLFRTFLVVFPHLQPILISLPPLLAAFCPLLSLLAAFYPVPIVITACCCLLHSYHHSLLLSFLSPLLSLLVAGCFILITSDFCPHLIITTAHCWLLHPQHHCLLLYASSPGLADGRFFLINFSIYCFC